MSFWHKLNSNLLGIFGKEKVAIEEKKISEKKETTETTENTEVTEEQVTTIKTEINEEKESKEEKEINKEIEITEEQEIKVEKVEFISEIDKIKQQLPDAFNPLSSMDEYWSAIIALEAVATSCASSDKDFSDKERKEIEKFVHRIEKEIPSDVQEKIDDLYQNPLPFNKAFLLAKESKIEMSFFEELLDLIIHVDGVKFEEKVILNAWNDFKKAS